MTFAQQFPELNQNQLHMLIRVIEDEVIGADELPKSIADVVCDHLNALRAAQRERINHLIKPTKD